MRIRAHYEERGQTLLMAVIAIIILFLAALFLFDLGTMIRVKIKAQTAADAAALAGADIQVKSLNLIGELNFVKACEVLVTDFAEEDAPDALMAASDNLTEMQARVSFVGPLLGLGAAQEAAKNNGMVSPSEVREDEDYSTFSLASYIAKVRDDSIYGNPSHFPQIIEGYSWREPYADMLQTISDQGVAAAPNVDLPNLPQCFGSPDFYSAIAYKYWCHHCFRNSRYRSCIKDDSNFEGQWWRGLLPGGSVRFIEESEIMPLHVEYTHEDASGLTYSSVYEDAHEYLWEMAKERGVVLLMESQLPFVKWCVYDSSWDQDAPGEGWVSESKFLYLRSGLAEKYRYGGAITKMTCLVPGGTGSKFSWLSGNYEAHSIKNRDGIISETEESTPEVRASATAKPLGYLTLDGEEISPTDSSMVLPVFHAARLIPVSMQPAVTFYDESFLIYELLVWLQNVEDINHPMSSPPPGTEGYLASLQKLDSPTWRHEGFNPTYSYTPPGEAPEYDPTTDTGAGWLQEPTGYTYDDYGQPDGVLGVNEDNCHRGGGGSNSGPKPPLH